MSTSYPKWIYVQTGSGVEGCVIQTPDDLKKVKGSWAESPAGPFSKPSTPKPKRPTKSRS